MTDTITLTILDAPGLTGLADLVGRPFTTRGRVSVDARKGKPVWLPQTRGCVFVDPAGVAYTASADGSPTKLGSLTEAVFGRTTLARFAHSAHLGLKFEGCLPKILAPCIEDDTAVDLCLDKARRLLDRGERIYLARENLTYAVREALERVGRTRRGDPAGLTLRAVFGTIS